MGAPFAFRLTPAELEWSRGRHVGRIRYDRIRRVRLSLSMQSSRFMTEVWPSDGPKLTIWSTSWRSIVEQQRLDEAYDAFIRRLHARIAAAGGATSFEAGWPALIYWLRLAVFVAMGVILVLLAIRALNMGSWGGAALIAAALVFATGWFGRFFRRNRPATYRPDALPDDVMPPRGEQRAVNRA
jgi:hypothetical protein